MANVFTGVPEPQFLDINQGLSGYLSGQQYGQARDKRLSEIAAGREAAAGNLSAAAAAAYKAGNIDAGARFAAMDTAQKEKVVDTVAAWATSVKNPTEWAQGIDVLERRLGVKLDDYRDFNTRDKIVAEAVGAKAMLAEARADKRAGEANARADRAFELEKEKFEHAKSKPTIVGAGDTALGVDGKPIYTAPSAPKPMTDGQANAGLYADRIAASNKVIDALEKVGTSLKDKTVAGVPLVGNYMVSNDYQKLEQAQRDFVNAVLRRESGAVINPDEFENAKKQYFPQPGDSKETIAQKKRNRAVAHEGITRAAGPAYERPQSGQNGRAVPAVGAIQQGFRFKGGDPADPGSWEEVR